MVNSHLIHQSSSNHHASHQPSSIILSIRMSWLVQGPFILDPAATTSCTSCPSCVAWTSEDQSILFALSSRLSIGRPVRPLLGWGAVLGRRSIPPCAAVAAVVSIGGAVRGELADPLDRPLTWIVRKGNHSSLELPWTVSVCHDFVPDHASNEGGQEHNSSWVG